MDRWDTAYFDNRLSPGAVAALEGLTDAQADAQALADRVFRLMQLARFDPADLTSLTAWMIGSGVPRAVPSAWDGAVPPITMTGRHQKLDDYLARNPWHRPMDEPVLVDLGCGFPPFTAVDSAAKLAGWRIIGADPWFSRFLVYDDRGDYACFDDEDHLRYYHTSAVDPDPAVTRARFRRLLHQLLPLLVGDNTGALGEVEHHGARLVRNPLRRYEGGNLVLTHGEIGSLDIKEGVDVIRCMNVFMYFDHAFRERALEWACGVLKPGGLFVCGSNWALSTSSRYTVYQEQGGHLVPREFAFSIDNVRPIALAPWYALHDDNLENLCNAEAVGIIRSDDGFRRRFDVRLDELLAQAGVCARGADGYLAGAAEETKLDDFEEHSADLVEQLDREGFVDDAVRALRRTGRDAWRNGVGHVAMQPVPPDPLAPSAVL
ncbi:MAG: class I SAM-dependent methyltransferase [Pseudonocardiaceae bacterium]